MDEWIPKTSIENEPIKAVGLLDSLITCATYICSDHPDSESYWSMINVRGNCEEWKFYPSKFAFFQ